MSREPGVTATLFDGPEGCDAMGDALMLERVEPGATVWVLDVTGPLDGDPQRFAASVAAHVATRSGRLGYLCGTDWITGVIPANEAGAFKFLNFSLAVRTEPTAETLVAQAEVLERFLDTYPASAYACRVLFEAAQRYLQAEELLADDSWARRSGVSEESLHERATRHLSRMEEQHADCGLIERSHALLAESAHGQSTRPQPATSLAPPTTPSPADAGVSERNGVPADTPRVLASADALVLPVLTHRPRGQYPAFALRMGVEGTVKLTAYVEVDGRVTNVVVVQGIPGRSGLNEASMAYVKRWRYLPARRGGTPVGVWIDVEVIYRIRESR